MTYREIFTLCHSTLFVTVESHFSLKAGAQNVIYIKEKNHLQRRRNVCYNRLSPGGYSDIWLDGGSLEREYHTKL